MPPIERPTTERLIEILRMNEDAGDMLCAHAADEIERLNREVSILLAECQRLKDRCVNGPAA